MVSGREATMGIGIESTWGTPVQPTVKVAFVSESLKSVLNYKEEDVLLGHKTTGRMDIMGEKAEGDITIIPHPDAVGELLACHFGSEADVTTSGSAYVHTFTHLASGPTASLPKFTLVVNRVMRAFRYTSCKSDTLKLSAKVQDYLRMTFTIRGRGEGSSVMISLADSATKGFKFRQGTVSIGGSAFATVTDINLNDANNLDNDLYAADGSQQMIEIEPNDRITTGDMEILYDSATQALKDAWYDAASPKSVVLTYVSDEVVGGTDPYKLIITLSNCYATDMPPNVGGPTRLRVRVSFRASEQNGTEAITVALHNGRDTKYLT
jgi:hypothetical protein